MPLGEEPLESRSRYIWGTSGRENRKENTSVMLNEGDANITLEERRKKSKRISDTWIRTRDVADLAFYRNGVAHSPAFRLKRKPQRDEHFSSRQNF